GLKKHPDLHYKSVFQQSSGSLKDLQRVVVFVQYQPIQTFQPLDVIEAYCWNWQSSEYGGALSHERQQSVGRKRCQCAADRCIKAGMQDRRLSIAQREVGAIMSDVAIFA